MASKLTKIIIIAITIAAVCYVYKLNSEFGQVYYSNTDKWSAPMALILLISFCLGMLLTALGGIVVGIKHRWREWKTERKLNFAKETISLLDSGREQLTIGNYEQASAYFQKVINRDQENIEANILLAASARDAGEPQKALAILEQERLTNKQNAELLVLTAELNAELGNYTSACDNLKLALDLNPKNPLLLSLLIEYLRDLDRFEDAIKYQKEKIRYSKSKDQEELQLELSWLELDHALSLEDSLQKEAITEIIKRHKSFGPALFELGSILLNEGDPKKASEMFSKSFIADGDEEALEKIALIWLDLNDPSKAIDSIKEAVKNKNVDHRAKITGQLFLVNLLLFLLKIDDAKKELDKIKSNSTLTSEEQAQLHTLEGIALKEQKLPEESSDALIEAIRSTIFIPGDALFSKDDDYADIKDFSSNLKEQPSPKFSTP